MGVSHIKIRFKKNIHAWVHVIIDLKDYASWVHNHKTDVISHGRESDTESRSYKFQRSLSSASAVEFEDAQSHYSS